MSGEKNLRRTHKKSAKRAAVSALLEAAVVLGMISPKTMMIKVMTAAAAAFPPLPIRLTAKAAAREDAKELTKLLPIRIAVKTAGSSFFKAASESALGSFF